MEVPTRQWLAARGLAVETLLRENFRTTYKLTNGAGVL
jgi:hypothetical protein